MYVFQHHVKSRKIDVDIIIHMINTGHFIITFWAFFFWGGAAKFKFSPGRQLLVPSLRYWRVALR